MRTNFNGSGCRARYDGAESTRLYRHEVSIVSSHVQLRNTFGRWSSFVVEAIARIPKEHEVWRADLLKML